MANSVAITFDELVNEVLAYNDKEGDEVFKARIPGFISIAESLIAAKLKILFEQRVVATKVKAGDERIEKPARWRKTVSASIDGSALTERTAEYGIRVASRLPRSKPEHWFDYDYNNLGLAPLPDKEYDIVLIYSEKVQPLSSENTVNLITREAPQAILFGTLLQAAYQLRNVEKIEYLNQKYESVMQDLLQENQRRQFDRNTSVVIEGS